MRAALVCVVIGLLASGCEKDEAATRKANMVTELDGVFYAALDMGADPRGVLAGNGYKEVSEGEHDGYVVKPRYPGRYGIGLREGATDLVFLKVVRGANVWIVLSRRGSGWGLKIESTNQEAVAAIAGAIMTEARANSRLD